MNPIHLFILMSVGLSASNTVLANDFLSKHATNNVACTSCHKNGFVAPNPAVCTTCHNIESVAKQTEKFNFTARLKNPKTQAEITHTALVNPHNSYHFGTSQACTDCHKEHKPSNNSCSTCHDIDAWKLGVPR